MANAFIQNTDTQSSSVDLLMQAINVSTNAVSQQETSKFSNIINSLDARTQKAQNNFEQKTKVTNTSSINKKALDKKEQTVITPQAQKVQHNDKKSAFKELNAKETKVATESMKKENATIEKEEIKQNEVSKKALTPQKQTNKTDNSQNLSDINNSSPVESSPVFSSQNEETTKEEPEINLKEIEKNLEDIINTIVISQNVEMVEKPIISFEDLNLENIETTQDLDVAIEEITNYLDNSNLNQETKDEILNLLNNIKNTLENTENLTKLNEEFNNELIKLQQKVDELINDETKIEQDFNQQKVKNEENLVDNSKEIEKIDNSKDKLEEIDLKEDSSIKNKFENTLKETKELIADLKEAIGKKDVEKIENTIKEISAKISEVKKEFSTDIKEINVELNDKIDDTLKNLEKFLEKKLENLSDKNVVEVDFSANIQNENQDLISLDMLKSTDFKNIEAQEKTAMNDILNLLNEVQNNQELSLDENQNEELKVQVEKLIKEINNNELSMDELNQAIDELPKEIKTQIREVQDIQVSNKENINTIDISSEFENTSSQNDTSKNENEFESNKQYQDIELTQDELKAFESDFDFSEVNLKGKTTQNVDVKNVEQNLQKSVAMQEMLDEMMVEVDIKTIPSNSGALSVADEVAKFAIGESNSLTSTTPIQNSVTYDSAGANAIIKNASNLMKTAQAQTTSQTPSMEDILNQVTNKITQLKDGQTQKLTMVLRPNDLGRLSIELSTNQNGLTTHIMAQNEDVRAYIERNIDSLRQQLADAGVNVNNIQIKTAGQEGSTNYEGNQNFNKDAQQENLNQEQNNKENKNNQQNRSNKDAKDVLASFSNYDMHFAKDFSSILNKSLNYNIN